ncbi:MAG TPA: MaoC family dehydratase, partial [Dehalococcoidia bacterium]|nr:MaoC family dehydratase [Dehalococcoidia bacterium]
TSLTAGHNFEPLTFTIDAAKSRAYTQATGDTLPLYDAENSAPPLAIAALALGVLLDAVGLPDGALHASESMRVLKPVPLGATLECRARLAQRSQRAGWIVTALDSEITLDGEPVLTTRATVMCPAESS